MTESAASKCWHRPRQSRCQLAASSASDRKSARSGMQSSQGVRPKNSAKQHELQLREQRLAEAKKRKEQRDIRAIKRKRARRPGKIADWGEREDVRCEPIERREPIDQNTTMKCLRFSRTAGSSSPTCSARWGAGGKSGQNSPRHWSAVTQPAAPSARLHIRPHIGLGPPAAIAYVRSPRPAVRLPKRSKRATRARRSG